jgi:hypothetical protein
MCVTSLFGFPDEIENWSVIDILHIKHIFCLSQARTWISNVFFVRSDFSIVDIGEIVDYNCLKSLSIILT